MSAQIKLFSRKSEPHAIGFVGVITADTEIFKETDMLYQVCAIKNNESFHAMFDTQNPIKPIEKFSFGEYDLENVENCGFTHLFRTDIWASYSDDCSDQTGGYIFVRKAQNFKGEKNHRYIICGAWKDTADFNQGKDILFYQGNIENDKVILSPSTPSHNAQGDNLANALKLPLWGTQETPYRMNSDLHINILNELFPFTQYIAQDNHYKNYQGNLSDNTKSVTVLCNNDEDYRQYLIALLNSGFDPIHKLYLQNEQYHIDSSEAGMNYFNNIG
jgi:hypothetical protein